MREIQESGKGKAKRSGTEREAEKICGELYISPWKTHSAGWQKTETTPLSWLSRSSHICLSPSFLYSFLHLSSPPRWSSFSPTSAWGLQIDQSLEDHMHRWEALKLWPHYVSFTISLDSRGPPTCAGQLPLSVIRAGPGNSVERRVQMAPRGSCLTTSTLLLQLNLGPNHIHRAY